jgi:methylmalonyl-CoA/ethylmalonyl-CoA epimerase
MSSAGPADLQFDHVGIVVADLDGACAQWARLLGAVQWTRRFNDDALGVSVRFARDGVGMVYEFIAPANPASPVAGVLRSGSNLLNQLAYRTRSLGSSTERLRAERALAIGPPAAALAFGGARVQFLMTPLGFLIELIETERVLHEFSC